LPLEPRRIDSIAIEPQSGATAKIILSEIGDGELDAVGILRPDDQRVLEGMEK
jgi:hypothetical protein